jgi:glycosyl transferase family 87
MGEQVSRREPHEVLAPDSEKIAPAENCDGATNCPPDASARHGTDSTRSSFRVWLTHGAIALLWLATAFYIINAGVFLVQHHYERSEDFAVFYLSALELRADIDPYATNFVPLEERMGIYTRGIVHGTHPPTFLALFEPLTKLPLRTAYWMWTGLNLAALVAALALLLGRRSHLDANTALVLAALAFWYMPVVPHFRFGQNNLLILFMLVLMMRWMERGRDAPAGLIFALAGLIRIIPFAVGGYIVLTRRWRVLAYAAIGAVLGAAATVYVVGMRHSVSFFYAVPEHYNDYMWLAGPANIAMEAFISRIFWGIWGPQPGATLSLVRVAAIVCADLTVLALAVRATLVRKAGDDPDGRIFSLWVATSMMLSPTMWMHGEVLLLLPFLQLASAFVQKRASRRSLDMAIVSVLLGYAALVIYLFFPESYPFLKTSLEECGFGSLLAGYVSTYWFATD